MFMGENQLMQMGLKADLRKTRINNSLTFRAVDCKMAICRKYRLGSAQNSAEISSNPFTQSSHF